MTTWWTYMLHRANPSNTCKTASVRFIACANWMAWFGLALPTKGCKGCKIWQGPSSLVDAVVCRKYTLEVVINMWIHFSLSICLRYTWAHVLLSWTNFNLANKQALENSYLLSWQSGQCAFICPCIWERPDVALEKSLLGATYQTSCQGRVEMRWHLQHPAHWAQYIWTLAKTLGKVFKTLTSLDHRVSSFSGQRCFSWNWAVK